MAKNDSFIGNNNPNNQGGPNYIPYGDRLSLEQEIVDYALRHPEDLGTVDVERARLKKEGDMGQLIMDLMRIDGPDLNPDKPTPGGTSSLF